MVRPEEKRRPTARKAGFTLTELMMVVTIIAITAGLAAPAMYNAFAERRASSAPLDFIRLVRRARSEAMAYGRAHLIRFDASSPGSFVAYRGVSSSCTGNAWNATVIAAGACGAAGSLCIDELDLGSDYYSNGALDIRATEAGASAFVDLCFEPTGRTMHRTSSSAPADTVAFSDSNTVGGGYIFNFRRYDGSTPIGVVRQAVVPLGGDARLLR